jgi:hypothetical protein
MDLNTLDNMEPEREAGLWECSDVGFRVCWAG